MNEHARTAGSLARYGRASERAADQIIRHYSTSFGAATRLLGRRHRQHVRNLYALVRIADELVDGVAAEAKLPVNEQRQRLDALEEETHEAIDSGYSSNPVVHAFAGSARLARIDRSLVQSFFASMRMDLEAPCEGNLAYFDRDHHAEYVYGSAEVVGLMCLRVFIREEDLQEARLRRLEDGARSLGAAFQNVNFLRDLADDRTRLGRSYLSDDQTFSEALKSEWVSTIRSQLAKAEAVVPDLPLDARAAVDCARRLFSRLTDKIEDTPVDQLLQHRVRVSNLTKALLVSRSLTATRRVVSS